MNDLSKWIAGERRKPKPKQFMSVIEIQFSILNSLFHSVDCQTRLYLFDNQRNCGRGQQGTSLIGFHSFKKKNNCHSLNIKKNALHSSGYTDIMKRIYRNSGTKLQLIYDLPGQHTMSSLSTCLYNVRHITRICILSMSS